MMGNDQWSEPKTKQIRTSSRDFVPESYPLSKDDVSPKRYEGAAILELGKHWADYLIHMCYGDVRRARRIFQRVQFNELFLGCTGRYARLLYSKCAQLAHDGRDRLGKELLREEQDLRDEFGYTRSEPKSDEAVSVYAKLWCTFLTYSFKEGDLRNKLLLIDNRPAMEGDVRDTKTFIFTSKILDLLVTLRSYDPTGWKSFPRTEKKTS